MPRSARPTSARGRDEIVERLLDLFRRCGFAGVSISDVSAATGLGKSSLYHWFPGGKSDMAKAVLEKVSEWTAAHLLEPLRGAGTRAERIDRMLTAVDALYAGGASPCLIAAMLVGESDAETAALLKALIDDWLAAMADALSATGVDPGEARLRAIDALSRIQGALVVVRATGDAGAFRHSLQRARDDLLAA